MPALKWLVIENILPQGKQIFLTNYLIKITLTAQIRSKVLLFFQLLILPSCYERIIFSEKVLFIYILFLARAQ